MSNFAGQIPPKAPPPRDPSCRATSVNPKMTNPWWFVTAAIVAAIACIAVLAIVLSAYCEHVLRNETGRVEMTRYESTPARIAFCRSIGLQPKVEFWQGGIPRVVGCSVALPHAP